MAICVNSLCFTNFSLGIEGQFFLACLASTGSSSSNPSTGKAVSARILSSVSDSQNARMPLVRETAHSIHPAQLVQSRLQQQLASHRFYR